MYMNKTIEELHELLKNGEVTVEELVKNISAEPGVTSISFEHQKQIETDSADTESEDN